MWDLPPKKATIKTDDVTKSDGNPRNSEGAFLRLKDGRIVYVYSRYRGDSCHDHAYCEIAAIYSSDEGETFSEPEILFAPRLEEQYDETNMMSVSLLRMQNGDIGVFYLLKRHNIVCELNMRRSSDELKTFSEPVRCVGDTPGYYEVNNDRVIRTSSGRLIVPAAKYQSEIGYYGPVNDFIDPRSCVAFFASDDDGYTWRRISGMISLYGGGYSNTGFQEPGVVELAPGLLYAYFRTDLGRQYESISIDGGSEWTMPQPSRFTSPYSPMQIKQNPYSGKFYAIWNPVPKYFGKPLASIWTGGRSPLVIAEGEFGANGISWGEPRIIEEDPRAGFCYPSVMYLSEKEALLAYCAGSAEFGDENCLTRVRIRKIGLES